MPALILNGNKTQARKKSRRLVIQRSEIREEGQEKPCEVPVEKIDYATVVGHPSISIPALQILMKEGIPISFISEKGHWYGTLHPNGDRNAARRIAQYEQYKNEQTRLLISKKIFHAKLANQRRVLQRLAANRKEAQHPEQQKILQEIDTLRIKGKKAEDRSTLRGFEGLASVYYFRRLAAFFPETHPFNGRNRRPPKDAANALLSWTYTILLSEIDVALRIHGLDPCIGWQHEIVSGRPALALDQLEPLRAPFGDLFALRLLNHAILKPSDFEQDYESGGIFLSESARKTFFIHYEKRMTRPFKLPGKTERTTLRKCIHSQVYQVLHLLENPNNPSPFFLMP
jgi:CRISPR-associated protein Cas1